MRVSGDPVSGNNGLFYVLSDHPSTSLRTSLGSTSMLVNTSGGVVAGSTTRYLPFGGYRGPAPSQAITDREFTGQKENRELGLLYDNARFYVPGNGRFNRLSSFTNCQSLTRYSTKISTRSPPSSSTISIILPCWPLLIASITC